MEGGVIAEEMGLEGKFGGKNERGMRENGGGNEVFLI